MTKNKNDEIEFYVGDYTKQNTFYRRVKRFKNRAHIDNSILAICTKKELPEFSFPTPSDDHLVKYYNYFMCLE